MSGEATEEGKQKADNHILSDNIYLFQNKKQEQLSTQTTGSSAAYFTAIKMDLLISLIAYKLRQWDSLTLLLTLYSVHINVHSAII